MNQIQRHFFSVAELVEQSLQEPNEILSTHELASRTGNVSFTGTRTIEDAIALATGGWEEGRKLVGDFTREYSSIWNKFFPQQDLTKELFTDITGSVPLVDKFIQGIPENMMEFGDGEEESQLGGCKLQRIILNGSVSCFIDTTTVMKYGALIGALVNSMELAGFNVELVICWKQCSSHFNRRNEENPENKNRGRYTLEIKRFNERLDVDKLAFCLAHSSMFRRFIFSLMEQENNEFIREVVKRAYGYPTNLTPEEVTAFGSQGGGQVKHGNMYFRLLDNNYALDQLVSQCTAVVREHFTEVNLNKE